MTYQFSEAETVLLIKALRGAERVSTARATSGTTGSDALTSEGSISLHSTLLIDLPNHFTNGASDATEEDIKQAFGVLMRKALPESVMPNLIHAPDGYIQIEDSKVDIRLLTRNAISDEVRIAPNALNEQIGETLNARFNTLNGRIMTAEINNAALERADLALWNAIRKGLDNCRGEHYQECSDAVLKSHGVTRTEGNAVAQPSR